MKRELTFARRTRAITVSGGLSEFEPSEFLRKKKARDTPVFPPFSRFFRGVFFVFPTAGGYISRPLSISRSSRLSRAYFIIFCLCVFFTGNFVGFCAVLILFLFQVVCRALIAIIAYRFEKWVAISDESEWFSMSFIFLYIIGFVVQFCQAKSENIYCLRIMIININLMIVLTIVFVCENFW